MRSLPVQSMHRWDDRNRRTAAISSNDFLSAAVATAEPPASLNEAAAPVFDRDPFKLLASVAQTLQTLDTKRVLSKPALRQFFDRFMSLKQTLESGVADPDQWMNAFETVTTELQEAVEQARVDREEAKVMHALDVVMFDATDQLERNQAILERKFRRLTGVID